MEKSQAGSDCTQPGAAPQERHPGPHLSAEPTEWLVLLKHQFSAGLQQRKAHLALSDGSAGRPQRPHAQAVSEDSLWPQPVLSVAPDTGPDPP